MICSVLLPSRERPNGLLRTVRSVFDTARHKDKVEVLIRMDDDDKTVEESIKNLAPFNAQIVVGPRGKGYMDVSKFVTEISLLAKGKWIAILDDDAFYVQKQGMPWDEQLNRLEAVKRCCQPECYHLNNSKYGRGATGPVGIMVPNGCWKEWGRDDIIFPHDAYLFEGAKSHGYQVSIIDNLIYCHQWRKEAPKQP